MFFFIGGNFSNLLGKQKNSRIETMETDQIDMSKVLTCGKILVPEGLVDV